MPERTHRVLIVGRSAAALLGAVDRLRELGYGANASNQFERLLEDYDVREVDLVLFGGMVPPTVRERLEYEVARINPSVQCASGRGGLAPLLAAQVQEHFQGAAPGVAYRAETRSISVALTDPAVVRIEAWWGEIVLPDVVAHAVPIHDGELAAGAHAIPIPDSVPERGSFAGVAVGNAMSVFQIGPPPEAVARIPVGSLPAPAPVTTQFPWQ